MVVLSGHISSDIVEDGEALRFWLTVENRTGAPIERLRIAELDTPGFKKVRWCWGPGAGAKGCASQRGENTPGIERQCSAPVAGGTGAQDEWLLCQTLKAGESLAVWGDVSVEDASLPPERLYAVVSWTAQTPANSAGAGGNSSAGASDRNFSATQVTGAGTASLASSKTVYLGTAEPVSALHVLTWLTKPEISIPGALTVLGLLLAGLAARRDERSKVFTAMLGSAHDAAVQYFMPMIGVLASAMLYIRKATSDAEPDENARRGFYYMTMFHWWQRRVFNKVGAYQLSSRVGEKLLLALAGKHRELYPRANEAAWRRLDVILSDLEKETTLDQFLGTLDSGDTDWAGAWADFAQWLKKEECKKDLHFLGAFTQVMVYEVNGLHELWYGTRSPMELTDETRAAILEVATGDFKYDVEKYLQEAENSDTTLRFWN